MGAKHEIPRIGLIIVAAIAAILLAPRSPAAAVEPPGANFTQ